MPLQTRMRPKNTLVLGVDIGTTFSAVSFFISTNDGRDSDPVFHEVSFCPDLSFNRSPILRSIVGQGRYDASCLVVLQSKSSFSISLFQVQRSHPSFITIIKIESGFVVQKQKMWFVYSAPNFLSIRNSFHLQGRTDVS